jgi:hypothetical protein
MKCKKCKVEIDKYHFSGICLDCFDKVFNKWILEKEEVEE